VNRFAERWVLITGASAGIGRATAEAFLAEGARVVAVARRMDALQSLATAYPADGSGDRVIIRTADVTDPAAMETLARDVLAGPGVPDVIVANAGVGADALFVETDEEMWSRVFETNVFGAVRTLRPFVRPMVRRGSGRLILVSSVVGKRGVPYYTTYSASKYALHGLADALRVELLKTGVTVGLVCPSSTVSEFHAMKATRGPRQASDRFRHHSAESVAQAILDLAAGGKRERVLSMEGKLMACLQRWTPGWLDRILYRVLMRPGEADHKS